MSALMLQGCGSDVGKSVLVAGLCWLFTNRGLQVRPFKPQTMPDNAAFTAARELAAALGQPFVIPALATLAGDPNLP